MIGTKRPNEMDIDEPYQVVVDEKKQRVTINMGMGRPSST